MPPCTQICRQTPDIFIPRSLWSEDSHEAQHHFFRSLETAKCAPSFSEGGHSSASCSLPVKLFVYEPEDTGQGGLVGSDRKGGGIKSNLYFPQKRLLGSAVITERQYFLNVDMSEEKSKQERIYFMMESSFENLIYKENTPMSAQNHFKLHFFELTDTNAEACRRKSSMH